MNRSSAMLLHLTSLPGPFGVGTIGPEAVKFSEKLGNSAFTFWQILPVNHVAYDSPYDLLSVFSGEPFLIDPRWLCDDGYLRKDEVKNFYCSASPFKTDYDFAHKNSKAYLDLAFSRISSEQRDQLRDFMNTDEWLADYASFSVLKKFFGNKAWWEWEDKGLKSHDETALDVFITEHYEEILREAFAQWIFELHWIRFRDACHLNGVGIIGDMPYYVACDSAEVWADRKFFSIGPDLLPIEVAGVPPDYFSDKGQLWGFPVYNWDAIEADGFTWWVNRIKHELSRFDYLRIDHFRGLADYWAVPYGNPDAVSGRWKEGPGMKLLDAAEQRLGKLPLIAEDLGVEDEKLKELLERSGLPGMKVLQFSFESVNEADDLPHCYVKNQVAYTGTHDNNTSLGWIWEAREDQREHALEYMNFSKEADWGKGGPGSPVCDAFIRTVWASVSDLAVAPVQDFLGFGSDARMNIPGIGEGCWRFRVSSEQLESIDWERALKLNVLYQRDCRFRP